MEDKNNKRTKNHWPATLYVEGKDQFRGWFNSSLITATILTNSPPYQQILTHGFVVDEKGHKMSKSLGNIISPEEIIDQFGVDVIRLWVVSTDFTKEVKISIPLLQEIQGGYQKIRNTFRFLLGNLSTLTSEDQLVKELEPADEWVLGKLNELITASQENYQKYNFNLIHQTLLNFCINDLSSFYFEISKDSLYCDSLEGLRRRQIITALYYLLEGLLKVISPIMPFLAEEVYENIPFSFGYANQESAIFLPKKSNFPTYKTENISLIENFLLLRQDVFSALEKARQAKIIHTNSQAKVLVIPKKEIEVSQFSLLNLVRLLLIAKIEFVKKNQDDFYERQNYLIKIEKTSAARCVRCWNYDELKKEVCSRCKKVLSMTRYYL